MWSTEHVVKARTEEINYLLLSDVQVVVGTEELASVDLGHE